MDQKEQNLIDAVCLSMHGYDIIAAATVSRPALNKTTTSEIFQNGSCDKEKIVSAIGWKETEKIFSGRNRDKALQIIETLRSFPDVHILCIYDEAYPSALKSCPDAPFVLFVKTESTVEEVFKDFDGISVIGTRDPSPYGKEQTAKIVYELQVKEKTPAVVSGLAMGIDTVAHKAALEAGMKTVAVMATGISDPVYPTINRTLAERIAATEGSALVTPFIPGTAPMAINFLLRNHVIAGLNNHTILVESKDRGGGILTARLAFDYGRQVYAVPGRLDDIRSTGCNRLIREGIAEML